MILLVLLNLVDKWRGLNLNYSAVKCATKYFFLPMACDANRSFGSCNAYKCHSPFFFKVFAGIFFVFLAKIWKSLHGYITDIPKREEHMLVFETLA